MIRSFLTVSSGTLASRLLGFVRDSAAGGAARRGRRWRMRSWRRFSWSMWCRRLLTEGGLNAALVPAWLRVRETDGAVAAAAFAGRVLGTVTAALIAATALLALADAARHHGAGAGICRRARRCSSPPTMRG